MSKPTRHGIIAILTLVGAACSSKSGLPRGQDGAADSANGSGGSLGSGGRTAGVGGGSGGVGAGGIATGAGASIGAGGTISGGDILDGDPIVVREVVPYTHAFTYDILPASSTGTYVAAGVLIGSTLK